MTTASNQIRVVFDANLFVQAAISGRGPAFAEIGQRFTEQFPEILILDPVVCLKLMRAG